MNEDIPYYVAPAHLGVGGLDLFRDEDTEYTARLVKSDRCSNRVITFTPVYHMVSSQNSVKYYRMTNNDRSKHLLQPTSVILTTYTLLLQ